MILNINKTAPVNNVDYNAYVEERTNVIFLTRIVNVDEGIDINHMNDNLDDDNIMIPCNTSSLGKSFSMFGSNFSKKLHYNSKIRCKNKKIDK